MKYIYLLDRDSTSYLFEEMGTQDEPRFRARPQWGDDGSSRCKVRQVVCHARPKYAAPSVIAVKSLARNSSYDEYEGNSSSLKQVAALGRTSVRYNCRGIRIRHDHQRRLPDSPCGSGRAGFRNCPAVD